MEDEITPNLGSPPQHSLDNTVKTLENPSEPHETSSEPHTPSSSACEPSESCDPRDLHATDRTYGAALRTVFLVAVISMGIRSQDESKQSAIIASALFLTFAMALLVFSGIRHKLNVDSLKKGAVRVDGLSPAFFYVLGLVASAFALVYAFQRLLAY